MKTYTLKRGDGCDVVWDGDEQVCDMDFSAKLLALVGPKDETLFAIMRDLYHRAVAAGWPSSGADSMQFTLTLST